MLAFPGMLVDAASKAGMKVPPDPDKFPKKEFPHFEVFCIMQLGKSMRTPGEHYENAKVIASISDDEIFKVTISDIVKRGFSVLDHQRTG